MSAEKIKHFIKDAAGYLAVALISIAYITTAIISIDKTGKTVSEIVADGALAFITGLLINIIFQIQGIKDGERDERVLAALEMHNKSVMRITPYIDKLDGWCEMQNKINLEMSRTKILARAGLLYSDCFDENGVAKDKTFTKNQKQKKRAYNKAKRLMLSPLTSYGLTCDNRRNGDIYDFGRTKKEYTKESTATDIVIKALVGCLFAYYGVKLITQFNYSELIWSILQVATFFCMGVIKMANAQSYMTDEYRSGVLKKIDNIQKFENYIERNTENVNSTESSSSVLQENNWK